MKAVKKAVIPVGGMGTRMLPATKVIPKELIPIVDQPCLQYVVEEAFNAGIEHIVFVTGRNKSTIEDYFDVAYEVEDLLEQRNKTKLLDKLQSLRPDAGTTSFTRQQEPMGLGHAIGCAKQLVGNDPFAVLLPDMLVQAKVGCLAQLMGTYARCGGNVIAVEHCHADLLHHYGVVATGRRNGTDVEILDMVEKPQPGQAPSSLIITGRYILQPEIMDLIGSAQPGAGGEIQLTDAMRQLMHSQSFHGTIHTGKTFDTGSPLGFLEANIAFALAQPDLAVPLRSMLLGLINQDSEVDGPGSEH